MKMRIIFINRYIYIYVEVLISKYLIYIKKIYIYIYPTKFRSQTSNNMQRWKSRGGKSQGGEVKRRERVRSKKMQVRETVGKSRFTLFFRGSKSNLAKAAGAEPAGQMRDEKLHAVVVRSTPPSQNAQTTPAPDHFWKPRCPKSARRCGAKHICKSKCTKHTRFGPLLEVEMSKKCTPLWREALLEVQVLERCTPLWREARFQVKMYRTRQLRTTFGSCDVEKVYAIVARSTFPSQKCKKPTVLSLF